MRSVGWIGDGAGVDLASDALGRSGGGWRGTGFTPKEEPLPQTPPLPTPPGHPRPILHHLCQSLPPKKKTKTGTRNQKS